MAPHGCSRARRDAIAGAILALGAPLGLVSIRAFLADGASFAWLRAEVASDPWTYLYVGSSTVFAFVLFGLVLGRQADRLYELSTSDSLTRLRNRRAFEERLQEEFARAVRHGSPLSILLVDLDRLKALNDRLGHRVGDDALSRVATAIRSGSRAMDVTARWGGDEFALLAPDTGGEDALRLAERVRALVAESGEAGQAITVSVGVVTLDVARRVADPEVLMRAADEALYEAKRQGRNRIVAAR